MAPVMQGEGFKIVTATRCETILAVTNLAIINCQIHGRNALTLKVCWVLLMAISCCIARYFLFRLPDLGYSPWH